MEMLYFDCPFGRIKPARKGRNFSMKKFAISGWYRGDVHLDNVDIKKHVAMWQELGLTVAMSPYYRLEQKDEVLALLDDCHARGMKLILCDIRTRWKALTEHGEAAFRKMLGEAIADFGAHPALYGFYVGDEPTMQERPDAALAVKIHLELAPHLTPYLNFLPYLDCVMRHFDHAPLEDYLGSFVEESGTKLLSYDCYRQMYEGDSAYDDYFTNLRIYAETFQKTGVPFWNTVLVTGHWGYRCPSKRDMQWQLASSVAMGAKGVSWYCLFSGNISSTMENYPINMLGEKTREYYWFRDVNTLFQHCYGELFNEYDIDCFYHVNKAYGGVPAFRSFGEIEAITSTQPLILSRFRNKKGEEIYVVCSNTPFEVAELSTTFSDGYRIERIINPGVFAPVGTKRDPLGNASGAVGQTVSEFLAPGQMSVYRTVKL